jgi:hypothetical protein
MRKSSRIAGILASISTALGTLWVAAGVLKFIFGVRITLAIFPPIDLERVAVWPAVSVGLLLVFCGAWLRRISLDSASNPAPSVSDAEPATHNVT